MPEYALSCIVCDKQLHNVFVNEVENQPDGGVCAISHGNYGSGVYDPLNAEFLEFNVCDECLTKAGAKGQVLSSRNARPVVTDAIGVIGWEKVQSPYVQWNKETAGYDDTCYVPVDELDPLPKNIELNFPVDEIRERVKAEEARRRDRARNRRPVE